MVVKNSVLSPQYSYRASEVSSKAPKRGTGYQHRLYCLKLLPFNLIFTYQREDDVVFSGNFLAIYSLVILDIGKGFFCIFYLDSVR